MNKRLKEKILKKKGRNKFQKIKEMEMAYVLKYSHNKEAESKREKLKMKI